MNIYEMCIGFDVVIATKNRSWQNCSENKSNVSIKTNNNNNQNQAKRKNIRYREKNKERFEMRSVCFIRSISFS